MAENSQRLRMVNIIGPEGTVIANGVLISPNAEDVKVENEVTQNTNVSANLKDFLFKKFSSTTETDDEGTVTIRTAGDDYFSIDPSKVSILQSWSDYQNLNKKRLVGLYGKDEKDNVVYIADFLSGIENLDSTLAQFETTDITANIGAVKTKYGFAGYVPVTGVDENGDFTTGAPVSADVQAKEFMASFGNSSFWQQIIDREIENKNRLLGVYDANGKVAGYFESTTADLEEVKKIYPNLTNEEVYNLVIDSNKKSLYQRIVNREIEDKNRLLGIYDANGNVVGYFEPTEANIEAIQEVYGLETYDEAYNLAMDLGAKSLYQRLVELNNFWQDLPSEYYRKTEQSGKNIATKYDIDGLSWAAIPIEPSGFDFSLLTDGNLIVTSHNQNLDPSPSLEIPESVGRRFIRAIDDFAFSQNTNVSEITIPFGVASIGENAFSGCSGLTKITINQALGEISGEPWGAPSNPEVIWTVPGLRYGLMDDGFGYQVLNIGTHTDKSLVIPNTYKGLPVLQIGAAAFANSAIESVIIPSNIVTIGNAAFAQCQNLTEVYYDGDVASWCNISFGYNVANPVEYAEKLYIKKSGANEYELLTNLVIPDGVAEIKDYAFYNCDSLTGAMIPDSVTIIGSKSFENCNNLTSVTIGNGVTSIDREAFYYCRKLMSVTMGNSVASIGDYAFKSCSSLASITIPDSVTSIGYAAFEGCSSLTSVTIPDSVASINSNTFKNCTSLTNVTISDSVTSIGAYAFEGCTGLMSVTLPNSVTSISSFAFYGCSSLTSVTIGNSVTSIGLFALQVGSSTNLATITFLGIDPPSITSDTFKADYLEKIIVPKGCKGKYIEITNWANLAEKIQEATA